MYSRQQSTDFTYMGGTRSFGPMTIILGSVIQSQHASLNINFGVNRTFHVLKTPVYRIDLYRRHRTLWTDDDNFRQCYLQLVYKTKFQIWCESDVLCAQTPGLPIFKSIALCVRTQSCLPQTHGRTDRHSSNVLEFCADQISPKNIGSQIIISRCYKSIDKTNRPSLRRG